MTQISAAGFQTLQTLSGAGVHYLTAQEGEELATLDLITVDPSSVSPNNPLAFKCELTETGIGVLTTPAPVPAPAPAPMPAAAPAAPAPPIPVATAPAGGFEIQSDVPVPKVKRGGSTSGSGRPNKYPFDQLQIGQSFHVPATAETIDKISRTMSTAVSNANTDSKVKDVPEVMETVTKYRYKKDAAGNFEKNAEGKKVRESYQVTEPKMTQTKFFIARKVSAAEGDPNGDGVRVFRVEG